LGGKLPRPGVSLVQVELRRTMTVAFPLRGVPTKPLTWIVALAGVGNHHDHTGVVVVAHLGAVQPVWLLDARGGWLVARASAESVGCKFRLDQHTQPEPASTLQ
jgi:hypothetical protein